MVKRDELAANNAKNGFSNFSLLISISSQKDSPEILINTLNILKMMIFVMLKNMCWL